jgi:hypothetical protein
VIGGPPLGMHNVAVVSAAAIRHPGDEAVSKLRWVAI